MNKFERLLNIESEFDLSELKINGLWIYPIIKQNLYVFDLSGNRSTLGLNKKSSLVKKTLRTLLANGERTRLSKCDLIAVDSANSRRFNKISGKYESPYSDYLHNLLSKYKVVTYERPGESGEVHYKNIPEINIYYPEKEIAKALIKAKLNSKKYDVSQFGLMREIINYMEANESILKFSSEKVSRFFSFYEHYYKILKMAKPKAVLLINAYNYANMAFVYAAKKLDIKTVELQHGFIRSDHPGYIYRRVESWELFPEYMLAYGDYFTDLLIKESVIFDKGNVFSCGAFANEVLLNEIMDDKKEIDRSKKIIYITGQWSVREKLKPFILKLSDLLPEDFKIVYKTHPLEKNTREFYSEFQRCKNIELVDDAGVNSLDLMPAAFVHSTAYSTSFMEAHFMNKPNIFIYAEGFSQVVEHFVNDETIFKARSPEEFALLIDKIKKDYERIKEKLHSEKDKFYKPNAGENISAAIEKIIGEA